MIFAIFLAWHVFAAEILDTEMSPQEKKQTGVYKLDDKQKAALQQWIDAHYQKRGTVAPTQISGCHPTLSENLMQSRYLRLSDNTLWHVRPEDITIAQGWITPAEIIVTQSTNPFFPYKLTNKTTGSSILARKTDKLPPKGAPPLAPENNEEWVIPSSKPEKTTP